MSLGPFPACVSRLHGATPPQKSRKTHSAPCPMYPHRGHARVGCRLMWFQSDGIRGSPLSGTARTILGLAATTATGRIRPVPATAPACGPTWVASAAVEPMEDTRALVTGPIMAAFTRCTLATTGTSRRTLATALTTRRTDTATGITGAATSSCGCVELATLSKAKRPDSRTVRLIVSTWPTGTLAKFR